MSRFVVQAAYYATVAGLFGLLALGYWLTQPRCPAHSAPLFFAYYGGWYCVSTVERIAR